MESIQGAALELAKRITTDKENHSGDELNTVIHLFDIAVIESDGIYLKYVNQSSKFSERIIPSKEAFLIHLKINPDSPALAEKHSKDYLILTTDILRYPISILRQSKDEQINSRNQAKSILSNIDDIGKIKFDFNNVDLIGPAFADELIRGLNKKEAVEIQWINSNDMIDIMMSHALKDFHSLLKKYIFLI